MSKIAITGARGFIAKNLRKKISSEYDLVSFSRKNFEPFRNEAAIITNYDSGLASNLRRCDTLVHLIGIGRQSLYSKYGDISKITLDLVNAAKSAKVKKIIYFSGLGVSKKNTSNYFMSKYEAEQYIIDSGLDYTIFRPSYIIGKDDHLTKSLNAQAKGGRILIPGSGNYTIQPIHISDVLRIVADAFENKNFSNKIIDLVGPEKTTFAKYAKMFARKKNVMVLHVSIEDCIKNALTDPAFAFGLDDINILLGGFVGDYKRLASIHRGMIGHVQDL